MAPSLHFVAAAAPDAQAALVTMRKQHNDVGGDKAEIVVALGGDGFMLQTLHSFIGKEKPIYGMNLGSVGFLMNEFREANLVERAQSAKGSTEALAFNDVHMFRETRQAAKIRIQVDNKPRINELICDGVLVSTPAGSTAYNLSAHGPILPIDAALLALTPISAFRPRRWHGALLPRRATVRFEILESAKRPVSAVADDLEVRDVTVVDIAEDRTVAMTMLFDAGHSLDERILAEQFVD
jgi:NAD+ kinase